jgi:hypothetical protein
MRSPLSAFRDYFLDWTLNFLWRRWSSLGAAGYDRSVPGPVTDPEALLLFSLSFARRDPRLFDEIMDWLSVNGHFINAARLKNIMRAESFAGAKVIPAVASYMAGHAKGGRWTGAFINGAAEPATSPDGQSAENLFARRDGKALAVFGRPDDDFLRRGFARAPLKLRGRSCAVRPDGGAALIFKLRALFGVGPRCEITAFLLTRDSAYPSQLARETHTAPGAAHDTLAEMAGSGLLRESRSQREKRYRLRRKEDWLRLLECPGGKPPEWMNWTALFGALEKIWAGVSAEKLLGAAPLVQATELRRLCGAVSPLIEQTPFADMLPDGSESQPEDFPPVFLAEIDRMLQRLDPLAARRQSGAAQA